MAKTKGEDNRPDRKHRKSTNALNGRATTPDGRPDSYPHELIKDLRGEANAVKDCFTRYSFQAIAFSGAALGLILAHLRDPFVDVASLLVIGIATAVSNIGIHKYGSANRHFGFELYLERVSRLQDAYTDEFTRKLLSVGWEEAMRAWRLVQASVFETVYEVNGTRQFTLRTNYADAEKNDWFKPEVLVGNRRKLKTSVWHPGSYLERMHGVLLLISVASILVIAAAIVLRVYAGLMGAPRVLVNDPALWASTMALLFALVFVAWTQCVIWRRRQILEKEMLSIHSCAVTWHAVVVAHLSALKSIRGKHRPGTLRGYIGELTEITETLTKNPRRIHCWILERTEDLGGLRLIRPTHLVSTTA